MKSPYPTPLESWGYSEDWHRKFERGAPPGSYPARVVRDHRGYFRVHTEKGELIATTAGRLKHNAEHASDLPAVGDFVALKEVREEGHQQGRGVIQLVLPRTTAFEAPRNVSASPTKRPRPACSVGVAVSRLATYAQMPRKIGLISARNKREVASERT